MPAEIRQPLPLKDFSESRIGEVWTAEDHAEIMRQVGRLEKEFSAQLERLVRAESSSGQDERLAQLKEQAIELSAQLEALERRRTA